MNNIANYQVNALRTEKPLPTSIDRLAHAALGLITETGEIATEVKRMVIYGKGLADVDPKTNLTRAQHIGEEIGDVLWYVAIAADVAQVSMEDLFNMPTRANSYALEVLELTTLDLSAAVGSFSALTITGRFVGVTELGEGDKRVVGEYLVSVMSALIDLSALVGISIDQIAGENIEKLRLRFPDAYSNEAAEARADKGGLDARNS
jgi:NTP pyrophosphatase (non-canonical NTP hydrolase)